MNVVADSRPLDDGCDSVDEIMRRHNESLVRFFRRGLPAHEDAEDLTQEVYVRLVQSVDLARVHKTKSFVFRIAINLLRDRLRYRRSRHLQEQVEYVDALQACESPAVERHLEGREKLAAVKTVIESLPPRCRDVFILHRMGGMSYGQIAHHLGIAQSTVEKHMMKAIAALKNGVTD